MDLTWILLLGAGAVAVLFIFLYNRLVALRQARRNAFSDIDVQLKQRHDLIPQLIETVKGYTTHEKELLEKITDARSSAMKASSTSDKAAAEGVLGGAMMNLFAVAENYPDLKASENFAKLQAELSDIENKIAAARRYFNNATAEFNTSIEQFPAVLIANMFGFKQEEFFELPEDSAAHQAPEVKF